MKLKSNIETIINTYETLKTTYKRLKENEKIKRLHNFSVAVGEITLYYCYFLPKLFDFVEKNRYNPINPAILLPVAAACIYIPLDGRFWCVII